MKNYFFTFCFLLTFSYAFAQGSLPSKKFSYKDYQGNVNVWAFLQDRAGFMYVGLTGSLIQYDGSTWRVAKSQRDSTRQNVARHFYEDKDGKVYAFGDGTVGFFTTNEKSELVFKSLLDKLPEKARTFTIGTRIMPMPDGIYFSAVEWLARWNGTEFTVWYAPKTTFTRGFSSHGKIYIRENETGVYEFDTKNGKFNYVAGSRAIFGQERISFFVPSKNGTSLVGARSKGIWLYNPSETDSTKKFIPINTGIDETVKANNIYDAIQLLNGDLLVNFFTGGVARFNSEGRFIKWVYQTTEFITTCYLDRTGQLWLGSSQNGIIRLSFDSPYTLWNIEELDNQVPSWLYHFKGQLYAGGVSRIAIYKNGQFITLKNSPVQPFSALEVQAEGQKMLLVGGFDGVVQVEGETVTVISRGLPVNQIFTHPKFPNRVFVADRGGMYTLLYKNGKWLQETTLKSFGREGWVTNLTLGRTFFYEESSGYLWGVRQNNEFAIITWDNRQEIDKPNIKFVQSKTKPVINNINFEYEKKLVFQANKVFYTYDSTKQDFIPLNFAKQYADNTFIGFVQSNKAKDTFYLPIRRKQGQLFVFNRFDVIHKKTDGSFVTDSTTHTHLPQVPILNSFLDGDSIYWISTNDNLLRYNLKKNVVIPQEFHTYIRQLKTVKEIVCGGTFCSNKDSVAQYRQAENAFLTFPYENNDITIQYAAPYFIDEEATKFSYFLEGAKRQEWSEWTTDTKKEYTNLREGKYTFKVKARNVFGYESDIATYKFVILPPWYRNWWAYLLYVVAGGLAITGLIYANSRRLIIAKKNLESLIRQRTAEIEKQKDEIAAQRDNLVELNEEINQQREEILLTAESLQLASNEISKKNDDILASINYARRIQFAMLPFEHRIEDFLGKNNFFVLYKPKDIVSGDFYIFEELQDKIFVAVADCTGHGVPGAFMSMIGNQLIHEIIVRDAIQRPDLVLNKLHCEIRRVLQQHESDTQDGMDIALVVIDKKQKSFEYAGAMNSIYYMLENTQTEIYEIAADKKPIGGRYFRDETERIFKYHTVQLPENEATTIYIFSDGYCDQFGGAENKKYMNRRFKENLLAMQNEPMKNQAAILENNITQWMEQGKEKQIDDILVLGVKIK